MAVVNALAQTSLYSVPIFLCVVVFKRMFKKQLSPALHYAVWFILLARLMLPFTFESSVRLFSYSVQPQAVYTMPQQPQGKQPAIEAEQQNQPEQPQMQARPLPTQTGRHTAYRGASRGAWDIYSLMLIIWLAGVIAVAIRFIYDRLKLGRRVRQSYIPPNDKLMALFERCTARMGINRSRIKLACQRELASPALMFPNTILLPEAMAEYDAVQAGMTLRHELMHYKRKDHIICMLMIPLLAVYWFNPVVWLANRMMREDMETACDSMVVQGMGSDGRKLYAQTVLAQFARPWPAGMLLGMANTQLIAEKRIRGIFMNNKSKTSIKAAAACMMVLLLISCFTTACVPVESKAVAAQAKSTGNEENPQQNADQILPPAIRGNVAEPATQAIMPEYTTIDWQHETQSIALQTDTNAKARIPRLDSYYTAEVTPFKWREEEMQPLMESLFPGAEIQRSPEFTKADYQEEIELFEKVLAGESVNGNPPMDLTDSDIKYYQGVIDDLKTKQKSAPDSIDDFSPVYVFKSKVEDGKPYPNNDEYCNFKVLNNEYTYYVEFERADDRDSLFIDMEEIHVDSNIPGGLYDPDAEMVHGMAEAKLAADEILKRMGIDYMVLSKSTQEEVSINGETSGHQGYVFYYVRLVNGLPETYFMDSGGFDSAQYGEDFWPMPEGEYLKMRIFDGMLTRMEWENIAKVESVQPVEGEVLSFDDAKDALVAYSEKKPLRPIVVSRIEQGMYKHFDKDTGKTALIPAWFFIGYAQGENGHADRPKLEERIEVVNALDGSVIDKFLRY